MTLKHRNIDLRSVKHGKALHIASEACGYDSYHQMRIDLLKLEFINRMVEEYAQASEFASHAWGSVEIPRDLNTLTGAYFADNYCRDAGIPRVSNDTHRGRLNTNPDQEGIEKCNRLNVSALEDLLNSGNAYEAGDDIDPDAYIYGTEVDVVQVSMIIGSATSLKLMVDVSTHDVLSGTLVSRGFGYGSELPLTVKQLDVICEPLSNSIREAVEDITD
ncbi:hypothetical protein A3709_19330 [Halioglobus sp. HI00S01]|nr:hypothetical protein A3709_19330 [Halioglobus sp. HI00S01]